MKYFIFFVGILFTNCTSAQSNNNCLIENDTMQKQTTQSKNVLGTELKPCCYDPMTGFYRDGFCETGPTDYGTHVVCARMTEEFLTYTKGRGNDLSTPMPMYNFPGLKPGDQWCLCVSRWKEAMLAGFPPPVILESTHEKALQVVTLEELRQFEVKE